MRESGIFQTIGIFFRNIIEKEVDAQIDKQKHRFQPKSLEDLLIVTNFNRTELKLIYRGFKEVCVCGG